MSERKRVRIVSNGNAYESRVIDLETGKDIPNIVEVDWHLELENPSTATIKTLFAEVDVATGAEVITVCPECGGEGAVEEIVRLRAENRALKDQVERLERGHMI